MSDHSPPPSGPVVDKVLLAEPRGFCAGVEMAIKALAWMVRSFQARCTATTRSSTTSSSSSDSRIRVSSSSTTIDEVPPGQPDHVVGTRIGTRGRRGRPGAGLVRRRLRLPARDQGAPRGQGSSGQGLPHRLRRPRGPRGGRRHDGRRPRCDQSGRIGRGGRRRCPTPTSRSRCSPRPRCRTVIGKASPSR